MNDPSNIPTDTCIGEIVIEDKFDPKDWLGELINDRYQIDTDPEKDILGKGTFGVVYRAKEKATDGGIDRYVAIKRLRGKLFGIEDVLREANTLSDASNNYTIAVYSSGSHKCEKTNITDPWISMEYVDNARTLNEYIEEEHCDIVERVRIVDLVCQGVDVLHSQNIIHGDLKPSNILISKCKGNEKPIPKIIDFGISKCLSRDYSKTYGYGTPTYRSKDQANGESATKKCDLHAIGIMLKELLEDRKEVGDLFLEWIWKKSIDPSTTLCSSANSIHVFLTGWQNMQAFGAKMNGFPTGDNESWGFGERTMNEEFIIRKYKDLWSPGVPGDDNFVFQTPESLTNDFTTTKIDSFTSHVKKYWRGATSHFNRTFIMLMLIEIMNTFSIPIPIDGRTTFFGDKNSNMHKDYPTAKKGDLWKGIGALNWKVHDGTKWQKHLLKKGDCSLGDRILAEAY
jgi:serine/threonine protein kinase